MKSMSRFSVLKLVPESIIILPNLKSIRKLYKVFDRNSLLKPPVHFGKADQREIKSGSNGLVIPLVLFEYFGVPEHPS